MAAYNETIDESLLLLTGFPSSAEVSDGITFKSDALPGWSFTIAETLSFTETVSPNASILVAEFLGLAPSVSAPGSSYSVSISELLIALDNVNAAKVFEDVIADSLIFSPALIDLHDMVHVLADSLIMSASVPSQGNLNLALSDIIQFTDILGNANSLVLTETLSFTEPVTFEPQVAYIEPLEDSLSVLDVVNEIFTASHKVEDVISLTDLSSTNIQAFLIAEEFLAFRVKVRSGDVPHICWVISTRENEPSIYSNFNFNSFARLGKTLYGAKEDGIYAMEGTDDDGVPFHTGVLFNLEDVDSPNTKRVRSVKVDSSSSTGTLQVRTDEGKEGSYDFIKKRALASRDVKGKKLLIFLEDLDSLEKVDLNLINLTSHR